MNLAHFHFAEPAWILLAVGGPLLLLALFAYAARARREQLARMASPHFAKELTASHSPGLRQFKQVLLLAVVALTGIALARPQWGIADSSRTVLGEDVVFVLDCSASMTATDVLPSRMQRAKYAMLDFVQRQSHGRVGLVAFAGSAFIQCPLTFDTGAFEETLMAMDENALPVPGTDIGRALGEAYQALDKKSRHKTIILVTDGEDLEGQGIAEAKMLATNGVTIFTIGVGTTAGKEIQVAGPSGQPEFLHDEKGQVVYSHLDEATLKQIAEVTGGSYFPLGPLGEGLARVRPAIQTLESSTQRVDQSGVDRYYIPIALLLVLLVGESLVTTRRREVPA